MSQVILFHPSNGFIMNSIDAWPPWALLYISIKIHKKYTVKIIDGRFDNDWRKTIDTELNGETICVGVTALTGTQMKYAIEFLKEIKKRMPNVKTVFGGIHATSAPIESVRESSIDFIIVGDGETSFGNLVAAIEKGGPYDNIKGIAFKDEKGNPVMTENQPYEELDSLDDFPLHLIDVYRYITIQEGRKKFIIFTSRGCPFVCSYCHNSNTYNRGRWKGVSAVNIVNFMKRMIRDYGITYFVIQDDNFWVSKERVNDFVDQIERERLNILWAVYGATIVSLKYINAEIINRFKRLGLRKVLCGIETVSPRIQKIVGKRINIDDVYAVDKIMSQAGVKMIYSFMSGFPNETNEDIKMNIDAMLKIKKQSPHNDVGCIKPLIYYPGTKLFDWAIEHGFKSPGTFDEWSTYTWSNYTRLNYPWISKKRKRFLQDLYFSTLLLNPDYEYIKSRPWKILSTILYPFTKWRVRRMYFKFSPVLSLFNLMKKLQLM